MVVPSHFMVEQVESDLTELLSKLLLFFFY